MEPSRQGTNHPLRQAGQSARRTASAGSVDVEGIPVEREETPNLAAAELQGTAVMGTAEDRVADRTARTSTVVSEASDADGREAARPELSATASSPRVPQRPVRVGGNVTAPTKLRHVPPVYPPAARRVRAQGMVILETVIGTTGEVEDVRVLRSVPLLDDAAITAVRQWRYSPTLLNDVPVPVVMTVTVNFTLQ